MKEAKEKQKEKNKGRSEKMPKGITLIALVITIIVLLILAGVSIATLTGENGILTKANEAKDKTQIADVKEPLTADKVEEALKNNKKVQYVTNYGIDIDGDGNATDDWEIFYIEDYQGEDGEVKSGNQPTKGKRIFLIASDYAKVQEINKKDDETYKETNQKTPIQKSIKKAGMTSSIRSGEEDYILYWSSSPTYHCTLPTKDKNPSGENKPACTFPKLFEFSQYNIKDNAVTTHQYSNSECASSLLCTGNWSDFANSNWADYATGGPSLEMWADSWNKRYPSNQVSITAETSGTGYTVETNTSGDGKTDPLYFPHTTSSFDVDGDSVQEKCWGYWLASPSYSSDSGANVWGASYGGFIFDDSYRAWECGVRPVVCLQSNVKLVKSSTELNIDGVDAECFELVK